MRILRKSPGSMQVKEQIKRLGDSIDLKLQLQETEYERRKAVNSTTQICLRHGR